jgi:hypothetical protein
VSAIAATGQAASRISPINERAYHQSNLLGDWKGTIKQNHAAVEFKVISINGDQAQVEYTHNGHTERGLASVDKNSIAFGNVTIGTRDGQQAAFEFAFQPQGQLAATGTQTAVLSKTAAPTTDANPLVGSWSGSSASHFVSFTVGAINGRDALVKYSVDGSSGQGVGDVAQNSVLLGKVQFVSTDGTNGKVTFQSGKNTVSLPVKRFVPKTA